MSNLPAELTVESSASAPLAHAPAPSQAREEPSWADAQVVRPTPLRTTRDPRRLDGWALVLVSKGIRSFSFFSDGVLELHVAPLDVARARAELAAADAEEREALRARRERAARPRPPATRHFVTGGVLVSVLLLALFAVTGPRAGGSAWFAAGASDAERVLHGEWWRAVTALTLHADTAHVVSNVGIGALVVGAVMRSEGVGWGSALVLAAGTLGNLANAWAHQSLHSSVGFSTAVFGAIGLLGGLTYTQVRARNSRTPAWTALAGSLALLAMLGSSERSDLFAHLFGGLAGVLLGIAVGFSRWRPRSALGQWSAGLGAASVVATAWMLALT